MSDGGGRRGRPGESPGRTVPVFYSEAYVTGGPAFDTTRKAAWIVASLQDRPIEGIELREPAPATADRLTRVHERAYVEAIRTGEPPERSDDGGFPWDLGLWTTTSASTGGAVAAALAAMDTGTGGSLSSGLHHARRSRGAGFCTFNGLAVAADAAIEQGVERVVIVDLDAHCGGGTAELLGDDPRVTTVDIATSYFDAYAQPAAWTLDLIVDSADYLPTLRRRLAAVDTDRRPLVIYNAGMDPFERCSTGGLDGITHALLAQREAAVFGWARERNLPIAFVLAGGYTGGRLDQDELVKLHRLTLEAAAAHR